MGAIVSGGVVTEVRKKPEALAIAGKTTTVFTLSRNSAAEELIEQQGALAADSEQWVAIIDSVQLYGTQELARKLREAKESGKSPAAIVFLLTPSTTSSSEFLTAQEFGSLNIVLLTSTFSNEQWDVRYIRRDNWFTSDWMSILEPMIEQDKKAYPKEEIENMYDYVVTQMHTQCYTPRAFVYWVVCCGYEEGELSEALEMMTGGQSNLDVTKGLPDLHISGKPAPVLVFEERAKRAYAGFGESAARIADVLGIPIERIDDVPGCTQVSDIGSLTTAINLWDSREAPPPETKDTIEEFVAMLSDREKQYLIEQAADAKAAMEAEEAAEEDADPVWESKWTIPEEERGVIEKDLQTKAKQCHYIARDVGDPKVLTANISLQSDQVQASIVNMAGEMEKQFFFPIETEIYKLEAEIREKLKPEWKGVLFLSDSGNTVEKTSLLKDHSSLAIQGRVDVPVAEHLNGWWVGESHLIVFLTPEDVRMAKDGKHLPSQLMMRASEVAGELSCTWVLVSDGIETFGPEYGYLFNVLGENVDNTLITTWDEMSTLKALFTSPGNLTKTISLSQVMFPRVRFFTLHTALGQALEDEEILHPELVFGDAVPLEASKFATKSKNTVFFQNKDKLPITRNVIPASPGDGGSIIMPAKLLARLLKQTYLDADERNKFVANNQSFYDSLGFSAASDNTYFLRAADDWIMDMICMIESQAGPRFDETVECDD